MRVRLNKHKLINITRKESGFSLVEVLIALLIAGFVMTVLNTFFFGQWRSWNTSEQNILLQQDLQLSTETIAQRVRLAVVKPIVTANSLTVINNISGVNTTIVFHYGWK